jgi:hypothetical protein
VESAALAYESFPSVLPGPLAAAVGVVEKLAVDGVGDVAFESRQRLFLGFALGHLEVEVGPPLGVGLADLTERGQVQGVVELTFAPPRQPMDDAACSGHFDGAAAVAGGVVVTVPEGDARSGGGEAGDRTAP